MGQREKLRKKRKEEERRAKEREKRIKVAIISAALVAVSVVFIAGAILFQLGGSEGTSRSNQDIERLLGGIPQEGLRLGNPEARRVLIEWGDLQCPACAAFAKGDLKEIIEKEVRPGNLQIEFRQWPILGPDSVLAAKAALAASLQGRYWQFIEYFYASQGQEGTGYVTDEFLEGIAKDSGVADIDKWNKDRNLPRWEEELLKNDEQAIELSFSGTPSFATEEDGKLSPIDNPKDLIGKE